MNFYFSVRSIGTGPRKRLPPMADGPAGLREAGARGHREDADDAKGAIRKVT